MAVSIGPKIGIEGEKEFRDSIRKINAEYKSLTAETRAVAAAYENQGDQQGKLEAQSKQLQKQIDNQRKGLDQLQDALKKASDKFGEDSIEANRLRTALYDTQYTVSQLEKELRDTDDQLSQLAEGFEEAADGAEDSEGSILTFGDALKAGIASGAILDAAREVGEAVLDIGQQAVEAAAEVQASNAQFGQTFRELEGTARAALESVADDTGIAVTRMQSGYTSLYAFSKSVGADSESALNIAQRAMVAAADSAAYYDKTVEEVTETLQSFLKGNYENDAALGIAATETTRNAKANELYAKSFQDLSEAQKVDVLLAMVEAGNAASGALGQAAREADSWSNVTGELAASWNQLLAALGSPVLSGLIPMIQGVTGAMNALTSTSAADELRQSMADFEATLEAANTALEQTRAETQTNVNMAGRYVSRLQALEKAGLDTAEAQEEYAATIELLNELLPGLNLMLDEQTGKLNMSAAAILQNAEALKQQAVQQQLQQRYTAAIEAQAAAEISLSDSKKRLIELETQAAELQAQGADAARVNATNTQLLAGEIVTLNGVYSENDAALAANLAEQAHLRMQLGESEAAYAALSTEVENAGAALDEFSAGQERAALTGGSVQAAAAGIQQRLDGLSAAYDAARAEAAESLETQIGLFQELTEESEYSAVSIVENWGKQQQAFANYSANLQKAADMGLDETLIAQLSDGTQQSMQILQAMVNDTEVRIDEINAAFRQMSEAKNTATGTMAEIKTAYGEAMDDIARDAQYSGVMIVDGLAVAIRDYTYVFENAMRDMGKKGTAAFNRTMEINSPSRVMAEAGDYTVDGLVLQIQRRTADLERTMAGMADAGSAALRDRLAYADSYPALVAGAPGYGTTTTTTNSVSLGGININITAQPGQSEQAIANYVIAELTAQLEQRGAAFG